MTRPKDHDPVGTPDRKPVGGRLCRAKGGRTDSRGIRPPTVDQGGFPCLSVGGRLRAKGGRIGSRASALQQMIGGGFPAGWRTLLLRHPGAPKANPERSELLATRTDHPETRSSRDISQRWRHGSMGDCVTRSRVPATPAPGRRGIAGADSRGNPPSHSRNHRRDPPKVCWRPLAGEDRSLLVRAQAPSNSQP